MDEARTRFLDAAREALREDRLVKMTLGGPCGPDETLRNVHVRPVVLRAGPRLQLVYRHQTRDVTRNLAWEDGLEALNLLVGSSFRTAHLYATDRSLQLELRPGKPPRLATGPPAHAEPASAAHNRAPTRTLPLDSSWLRGLGVVDRDGRTLRGMEGKLRQIHRFVEILSHLLAGWDRASGRLQVVDLGCGKGYLTFAAYQWLRASGWPEATVVGVELRPALVEAANRLAAEVGYPGLSFESGAIADRALGAADVVIALHACDTATDDALALGVASSARLLVVAPCCHREVRPQLRPPPPLAAIGAHGILREREAELVTDALRAAALEAAGYAAKVFEFVSTEHTAKNLMIAAERRDPAVVGPAGGELDRVRALASFYGVARQRLADRLGLLPE